MILTPADLPKTVRMHSDRPAGASFYRADAPTTGPRPLECLFYIETRYSPENRSGSGNRYLMETPDDWFCYVGSYRAYHTIGDICTVDRDGRVSDYQWETRTEDEFWELFGLLCQEAFS